MPTSSVSNVTLKNIRETSNNTSIAQKLLINRQNKCDQNKPRSAASATSNVDDENTQNLTQNLEEEIKRLKNEVASLKKDHALPVQHVIPVWWQILPAPPSKSSPQKIIRDSNSNQVRSKALQMASILNGGRFQIYSKSYGNIVNLQKAISRAAWYRDEPDGNVINLSKHSFTKKQFKVLNKNLNFCPTPGYYNKKEIMSKSMFIKMTKSKSC